MKNLLVLVISFSILIGCNNCEKDIIFDVPYFLTSDCLERDDQCAMSKMLELIYNELQYPEIAREMEIEGIVKVKFTITDDGHVTSATVEEGINVECDQEALSLVDLLSFVPAKNECGDNIDSEMTLFIEFEL